jgi:hypothetical protein
MNSKTETVLQTLASLLAAGCTAPVIRNTALPEVVPPEGLVIIYDGDPGQSDKTLGGFDPVYYEHAIDIILFVEEGDASQRDTTFDALVAEVKSVFRTHPDLDGAVFGLTYDHPKTEVVPVVGGTALKSGTITLRVDYEDPLP